jgi:hypothetical protein
MRVEILTVGFSVRSTLDLGPRQPPMPWVSRAVSPGLRVSDHEISHSHPSSAEVKNGGAITPFSHTSSWLGA